MNEDEFRVNAESTRQALQVTADLRKSHIESIERHIPRVPLAGGHGWFRRYLRPEDADQISALTSPLDQIASDIPLPDVRTDVVDFALVVSLAVQADGVIAMLRMGEKGKRVPILPRHKILPDLFRSLGRSFREVFANVPAAQAVSIAEAQEVFFQGLSTFLAARISGMPWLRRHPTSPAPLGGGAPGVPGSSPVHQRWTAKTQASGLAMYYAGTHAARYPPNYLGAQTTPLTIFLPVGTLHLGADAGPGGAIVWDPSVITVPSHTPIFSTRAF
jgi:hypothetical protein